MASSGLTRRILVFDRDGLDALIPAPADPAPNAPLITFAGDRAEALERQAQPLPAAGAGEPAAAAATPESVQAAREAAFGVFFREAPLIAERNGVPWPGRLEQAVGAYLAEHGAPLPPSAP